MSPTALGVSALMVAANAFFVFFEFALVAIEPSRLKALAREGRTAARMGLDAVDDIDEFLSACQLGITISSLSLTAAFEPALRGVLQPVLTDWMPGGAALTVSIGAALLIATSVQVIFGELAPKTIAIVEPRPILLATIRPMRWFYRASIPFNATYNRVANWVVHRYTGANPADPRHRVNNMDVTLVQAVEQGAINPTQKAIMDAVLDLPERTAREIMTPAEQVVRFAIDDDTEDVIAEMGAARHSRYPVFEGEQLQGYVKLHDVFRQRIRGAVDLEQLIRPIDKLPESARLKQVHDHVSEYPITAVFDEFNQFVGIITDEDVAEEILGDILDEQDTHTAPTLRPTTRGSVVIDGEVLLEDVMEEIGLDVDIPDGIDTFGGLVMAYLERQPRVDDELVLDSWTFRVTEVEGFAIKRIEGQRRFAQKRDSTEDG